MAVKQPKNVQSSFNIWRKAVPRLKRVFKDLDDIKAQVKDDELGQRLAIMDYELKANREVRETLATEIKVRREVAELRKIEYDGLSETEIEDILMRIATRRGFRSIDNVRKHAVEYLMQRGASADAAHLLVDEVIPPVKMERKLKPLESIVRAHFNDLNAHLDEGIRDVGELLAPRSSEGKPSHGGTATKDNAMESHTDDTGDTGGASEPSS